MFISLPAAIYLLARSAQFTHSLFVPAWFFGLGYFGAGVSWVHVSIAEFGGMPLIASLALMLLLSAYLALFPALAFKYLAKYCKPTLWPLSLPLTWFVMEWLRARLLTGFPWLSIAYSQSNSILSAWLPIIGEVGLSILIIIACVSLAIACLQKQYWHGVTPLLVLFISSWVLNDIHWTQVTGNTRSVALVQGNIEQSNRWQPERDQITIDKYMALTQEYWGYDLIIWPEAALPRLELLVQDELIWLDNKASESNTGFISGVVDYNLKTDIAHNSLLALGIDKDINSQPYHYQHEKRFSKHHLLPIGEFVPFEAILRPLAPIFDLPMSSFSRGEYVQSNLIAGNTYLTPAICFEIAFPRQISANLSTQSQFILTVSNDAWFGDSHGPHQHLQIAQVRAKEFGLPVLRATNNGVTAIINHRGEITHTLEQFTAAVLSADVAIVSGQTPYRRFHDWPIFIFSLLLCGLAVFQSTRFTLRKN